MKNKLYDFLSYFFRKIKQDEILVYAQALTFNSLLTVIPLLGLSFIIAKAFIPQERLVEQFISSLTNYLTPEALRKATDLILKFIKKLESFPLGKFSVILYFLMGVGLLFQLEEFLNKVFEIQRRRKLFQRIIFFWVCLTLTPFIFLIPFTFLIKIDQFYTYFISLFLFSFFLCIYIFFPAKEINIKESLFGALFSTCLWFITSYLFILYLKYISSYSKIYGSLAIFPFFLIWIYLNWLIFLLGAELIVVLERKPWKIKFKTLPKSFIKVLILYLLAKIFMKNGPLAFEVLEKHIEIDPLQLRSILQELEAQELIVIKEEKIYLTKTPENITLAQVLELNFKLPPNYPPNSPIFECYERLKILYIEKTNPSLKDLLA